MKFKKIKTYFFETFNEINNLHYTLYVNYNQRIYLFNLK